MGENYRGGITPIHWRQETEMCFKATRRYRKASVSSLPVDKEESLTDRSCIVLHFYNNSQLVFNVSLSFFIIYASCFTFIFYHLCILFSYLSVYLFMHLFIRVLLYLCSYFTYICTFTNNCSSFYVLTASILL